LGVFFYIYKKNMPTFTPVQLSGNGAVTASGNSAITIQFQNPSSSGYFFQEQITGRNANGFIPYGTTDFVTGSFNSFVNINEKNIVTNQFKFGVAVPPGSSSINFTPTDKTGNGSIRLKGIGNFTIII